MSIMEIIQESFDIFNSIWFLLPWNWLGQWFGFLRLDLGQAYAYGALGDVSMARTNLRCSANTFSDLKKYGKADYEMETEVDYYLNAVQATQ